MWAKTAQEGLTFNSPSQTSWSSIRPFTTYPGAASETNVPPTSVPVLGLRLGPKWHLINETAGSSPASRSVLRASPQNLLRKLTLFPRGKNLPGRRKQKTPIRPGRMAPMRSKSNRSLSPALPGPGCGLPGPQISPGLGHGHGTGSSASVLRLDQDDAGQDEARGPVRLILTASHGLQ